MKTNLPIPIENLTTEINGKHYPVSSFREAQERQQHTIATLNIGASQTPAVVIYQGKNPLAHISYNGRVWEGLPQDWNSKTKMLLERP